MVSTTSTNLDVLTVYADNLVAAVKGPVLARRGVVEDLA